MAFSIHTIKKQLPLTPKSEAEIATSRSILQAILNGRDRRLFLIVGPCALQSPTSAIEYAKRLVVLQEEVKDSFFLVMRAYYEKARSLSGWKGIVHGFWEGHSGNPSLSSLYHARQLLQRLVRVGVPLASEIVDPSIAPLLCDSLSWTSIGARTVYSQTHRLFASRLSIPCGMKNSIEGSIEAACSAVHVANEPHLFFGTSDDGTIALISSPGNPYAHIVLRGSLLAPNYSQKDVEYARGVLQKMELNQSIVVDCSHGNSQGDFRKQINVFHEVLESIVSGQNSSVKGLMLESFLEEGSTRNLDLASISQHERESMSCVDPCLSWKTTEELIRYGHALLQKQTFLTTVPS